MLLRPSPHTPAVQLPPLQAVSAAAVQPTIIDGAVASPGLLSGILTDRYLDHLPLYRLEQIAARDQVFCRAPT